MFVVGRRGLSVQALLDPHNGHLSAFPSLCFMILLKLFGLDHYGGFRLAAIAVHLSVALLAGLMVKRRHGWLLGLTMLVIIGLMGAGWQNIFWGFQIGFMGSLFFFLLSLHLLDLGRQRSSTTLYVLSSVALACSLSSAGLGVAALVALVAACWLAGDRRNIWWIPVGPAVMYGLWYLVYGTSQAELSSAQNIPLYSSQSASGSAAGIFGVDQIWGALLVGSLLYLLARRFGARRLELRSTIVLVFAAVFWTLVALSRTVVWEPTASRYLYVGIVALLVGVSDVSITTVAGSRADRLSRGAVVILGALAVWGSHSSLLQGATWLKNEGDIVSAELAVVMMHRDGLDPTLAVDPVHAFMLSVGDYLAAVDDLGSSAAIDPQTIELSSEQARRGADLMLNNLVVPSALGENFNCEASGPRPQTIELAPGSNLTVRVSAQTSFVLSRFAPPELSRTGGRLLEVGLYRFNIPMDEVATPWKLTFELPVEEIACDM